MAKLKISDELTEFIRKRTLYPEKYPITSDTSIENDLGVTGDDSAIFMEAFFEEFNIDPGDFDCSKYFEGEGVFNPFAALARLIFRKADKTYTRISLTVGMLQRAIELGVWSNQRLRETDNTSHE